ncbi:MAG: nucleotidyltransferase domain-containing protein [Granulosicoccus sp.]
MAAGTPIELVKQATLADRRFAAAIVFGSQARGTARLDSDIDLAVLMSKPFRLSEDYLDTLGVLCVTAQRDVHMVDLEGASLELQRAIFKHGLTLFDRSAGKLSYIRKQSAINYVDAEFTRRILDEHLGRRLEQTLG